MGESPMIIRLNIAHYQAILRLDMSDEKRSLVEQLLAEAQNHLVLAMRAGAEDDAGSGA